MTIERGLQQVADERARQDERWGKPAERGLTAETWLAILGEECGEVCRASLPDGQGRGGDLRHELVQVAAVCQAWCEALLPYEPAGEITSAVASCVPSQGDDRRLARLMLALGAVAEVAHLSAHGPQSTAERLVYLAAVAVAWCAALDPDPSKE